MRFHFDERKSKTFGEIQNVESGSRKPRKSFRIPYYLDQRRDWPQQFRAIGWVGERLDSLVFEIREDTEGEFLHLVTLWRATSEERKLYEENS